jgi:hypothetical protein
LAGIQGPADLRHPLERFQDRTDRALRKPDNARANYTGGEEGVGTTLTFKGPKPALERPKGMVFVLPIEPGLFSGYGCYRSDDQKSFKSLI